MKRSEKRLSKQMEVVEGILRDYPSARDSDYLLYAFYLNKNGYSKNMSFWGIVDLIKRKEISSIESISRMRRKLQEMYKELRASSQVESARRENEKVCREIAHYDFK